MKKKQTFFTFIILFMIFGLCGCAINTDGNTLYGFTQRMNEKKKSYQMTTAGYIYNKNDSTLTKYYIFDKVNIMLSFNVDKNNELSTLNIVFDNLTESNTNEIEFIKNSIECYCNNSEISGPLLDEVNFPQVLFRKEINTTKSKIGNTEILIDVTDIGCVITVVQNTL